MRPSWPRCRSKDNDMTRRMAYLVDEEYLVTAFVPSETACLASSPGRMSRTLKSSSVGTGYPRFRCAIRSLDLSGRDGGFLVVGGKLGCLGRHTLEDIYVVQLGRETRRQCRVSLPLTKEFRMDMARLEIPVSGWTCLRTVDSTLDGLIMGRNIKEQDAKECANCTFVDVRGVSLLSGLGPLLLIARWRRRLLSGLLLLRGCLSSWGLATSAGLLLGSFGRHF